MSLNQILLTLSVLSLHTGFGLALGILWRRSRHHDQGLLWTLLTAAFLTFVFIPSCLVILGLDELHGLFRIFSLFLGLIAALLPFYREGWIATRLNPRMLRKIYPVVSMFLLASWSTTVFIQDGIASGVPLALFSALAGFLALQRKPQAT